MDWWEQATSDLLPLLRKNSNLTIDVIDTLGYYAVLRFNHLYPPFNNAAIRRALLGALSETDMMTAVAGADRSMWTAGCRHIHPKLAARE
jgi:peptide/nickel transport system substrate-binding protein